MDSFYPEDMLVGFFPLVFAINAVQAVETDLIGGENGKQTRSLFDRFLDAIAASLNDESENSAETRRGANRTISLFRGEDEETSDEEDAVLQEHCSTGGGPQRKRSGGFGFGRRSVTVAESSTDETSYAKALTTGQGFFQRARIVTISNKYGFPPSKDPEGSRNLAFELNNLHNRRTQEKFKAFQLIFQQYPISGIIPSGWLEKHVHALPSAIMVVCSVCASQKLQAEQDRLLFQTIEHLQYSLVPKRQCSIQVVGIMKDDVTDEQGHEWSQAITHDLVLEDNANTPFTVTMLRARLDLQRAEGDVGSSEAMRRLKRRAREASLLYYLRQARRTKDKLFKLIGGKRKSGPPPVQLSPLIVRYCFKIAIFYEFQMKYEKSLRFMAEGYRSIVRYYHWLLSLPAITSNNPEPDDQIEHDDAKSTGASTASVHDTGESVEVELTGDAGHESTNTWSKAIPAPPDDIMYQCRAVADWLNLKLLTAGFASHTEDGLVAASNQWRLHSRVFATCRYSSKLKIDGWFEWAYISRQRIVTSQLVERHPPKALGDVGNDFDEIILRCSPWLTYESATEAMLRLAREMDKAKASGKFPLEAQEERNDVVRARFVGGLSTDGLRQDFVKECSVNHRSKALDFILRAISIFEHELVKTKRGFFAEDEFSERSSSRTGARLYYLAGGILLGMCRHEEALGHLSKSLRYSRGWRELELSVRRLLIECYEKHIPSQSEASESSDALVSMILDSYFNAKMSSQDLRKALDHFASISGGDSLKWYHETRNEEDTSLPFSFAVSFPGKTHAASGETVEASVVIKSNLDYAIHVNSVALGTLAGKLPISAFDLLSAINANEGSDGGIIIQANAAIIVSTKLELPRDLSAIAFDESGNGGELLGVSGKGSFAKNAKPRTAGITSAGGARLVSEEKLQRGSSNSHGWNVRFLGGKPLLCDGLHLSFYPVQAGKGTTENITLIELTIEKKKMKTAANIKRTPFEEENYIASAWSRPQHLPFCRGPRSIRVLGPQPELVVTDVTNSVTNGRAMEGTVNRILLKLQAGPKESCTDFEVDISCFSVLMTPSGATMRLVSEDALTAEAENSINMSNPIYRTPILVTPSSAESKSASTTLLGYDLPNGWQPAGNGQKVTLTNVASVARGESTYLLLDLFRPSACTKRPTTSSNNAGVDESVALGLCKTDFYVAISYRQERRIDQSQKPQRGRRVSRKLPVMSSSSNNTSDGINSSATSTDSVSGVFYEKVSLEFEGSIVWNAPMTVHFIPGARRGHPSGIRHESNRLDYSAPAKPDEVYLLSSGQAFSTRCSLQLDPSVDGLMTEILSTSFEPTKQPEDPVIVSVEPSIGPNEGKPNVYIFDENDPCRLLSSGGKVGISYTLRAQLKDNWRSDNASVSLGSLLIDWKPVPLELPDEVSTCPGIVDSFKAHGPLALDSPSTIRFTCPHYYVERTPFVVETLNHPWPINVGVCFELKYSVKNTTSLHQSLSIHVAEDEPDGMVSSWLLWAGCKSGSLSLGPFETHVVCLSVIATRSGAAKLPSLVISSDRYESWVIHNGGASRQLYVLPQTD